MLLLYKASKQASKQAASKNIPLPPKKKKKEKNKCNNNNKSMLQQSRQASKKMLKQNSSKHNSLFFTNSETQNDHCLEYLENMGGLNCISLVVFAVGGGDTYLLAASYRHLLHQWQKALEKGEGFGERDGFL
jgi:hypothetical protein